MDSVFTQIGYAIALAFLDIVTFPWWWYTAGARGVLRWAWRSFRGWEQFVGFRMWAKHLLVPMFGQHDWQSRIISVVIRVGILLGRAVEVLVGAAFVVAATVAYFTLPVGAVVALIRGLV
jgi:hypothetical protein